MSAEWARELVERMRVDGEQEDIFRSVCKARRDGDLGTMFSGITRIYELEWPRIERGEYDPYIVDWGCLMTPIEVDVWFSIRTLGLKMYPQFPAGRFFADFANPHTSQIIECDGKEWHNAEKDKRRDAELREIGWSVLRIPGWRCRLGEFDPRGSHQMIRCEYGFGPTVDPDIECEEEEFY